MTSPQTPSAQTPSLEGPRAGSGRAPWSLQLAAWAWGISGMLLALAPLAGALLLYLQYRSLLRNAQRVTSLVDVIDAENVIAADRLREILRSAEDVLNSTPTWLLVIALLLYLVVAICLLTVYFTITRCTGLGHQWARITGTVLTALSAVALLQTWLFFLTVSWVPLNALLVIHSGIAALILHVLGVVLVWLRPSNAYVRTKAAARRAEARRVAAERAAAQQVAVHGGGAHR